MRIGMFRGTVACLALALGAASPATAAELIPFKIGISAPVVTIFPVWMGEAGGFYEKEGIKAEVINMEGGTRGLQVLLSAKSRACMSASRRRCSPTSRAPTCGW